VTTAIALVAIGLVAGALGASLGIGGGVIFVPALVLVAGFGQHLAEGTSLAVILPTAIVGTWVHHRHHRVVWPTAVTVGLAGIVGALAGSRLALSLDGTVLRRLYAVLLLVVIVQLTIRSVHMARDQRERRAGSST
jgi:uncharacterized membrane protein YfcA